MAGTERHVADVCGGLRARGWRTLVVAREDVSPRAREAYESVAEVKILGSRSLPGVVRGLVDTAREEHAAILHGHLGNGSFAALFAGRLAGVPVVSTAHFVRPRHTVRQGAALLRPPHRALMRRMSAIIAVSEAVATPLRQALGPAGSRVHVVLNGVDAGPPAPTTGPRRPPVILFGGRLESEKQPDLLIRAVAALAGDCELWFAGEGSLRPQLERLAKQMLPGRCRFLGFVSDLAPYVADARLLALTSAEESFGFVLVEAMRAGRPVVAFAVGGVPEVVEHERTGLLAPSGDVQSLARCLQRLIDDERLALQMGLAGRRRYCELFTASRMAEDTEAVYEAVLAGRS
jgi:glycosyltransferase involved in cell wall biosynthesis